MKHTCRIGESLEVLAPEIVARNRRWDGRRKGRSMSHPTRFVSMIASVFPSLSLNAPIQSSNPGPLWTGCGAATKKARSILEAAREARVRVLQSDVRSLTEAERKRLESAIEILERIARPKSEI